MSSDGKAIDMKTNMNSTEYHTGKAMVSLKVAHVACAQASMRMLMQTCKQVACSLTG